MKKGSKPSLHHIYVHPYTNIKYTYVYICTYLQVYAAYVYKYPIRTIQNAKLRCACVSGSVLRQKWCSKGIRNLSNKFYSLPYFIFRQKHFLQSKWSKSKVMLSTFIFQAVFGFYYLVAHTHTREHQNLCANFFCYCYAFLFYLLLIFNHSMIEN